MIVSAWPGIGGWVRGWWLGIGEGSADTLWVEARDSAEHPRVLREALTIKDQPAPNVRSASIERLWISVFFPVYPPTQVPWLCLSSDLPLQVYFFQENEVHGYRDLAISLGSHGKGKCFLYHYSL